MEASGQTPPQPSPQAEQPAPVQTQPAAAPGQEPTPTPDPNAQQGQPAQQVQAGQQADPSVAVGYPGNAADETEESQNDPNAFAERKAREAAGQ